MTERQYIVLNKYFTLHDAMTWLSSNTTKEKYPDTAVYIDSTWDMYDVLVDEGIFKSKGEARRNWNKTGKEIPDGFSLFEKVGKFNKTICIINLTA